MIIQENCSVCKAKNLIFIFPFFSILCLAKKKRRGKLRTKNKERQLRLKIYNIQLEFNKHALLEEIQGCSARPEGEY